MDLKHYVSHDPFHLQPMDASPSPSPISLPLSKPQTPSADHPDPALQPASLNHVMNNFHSEPGALSLHNYRKYLTHGGSSTSVDGHDFKRLRRKNAALNLNQPSEHPHSVSPFSISSASSPPPLSPSSSPSAVSEMGAESLRGFLLSPNHVDLASCERPGQRLNSYKILDTFRDRLEKYPEPDPTPSIRGHSKTYSDSALLHVPRDPDSTVISHNGTSFEILNPHESLRFARIVSYIEDVDTYSVPSSSGHSPHRDSYRSDDDGVAIMDESFLDYEDQHLYHYPVEETYGGEYDITTDPNSSTNTPSHVHHDLVGDSPHHPMPSISERLEETDPESISSPDDFHRPAYPHSHPHPYSQSQSHSYSFSHSHSYSPPNRSSRLWAPRSFDSSELGEPGPPLFEEPPTDTNTSFRTHRYTRSYSSPRLFDPNAAAPDSQGSVNRWHHHYHQEQQQQQQRHPPSPRRTLKKEPGNQNQNPKPIPGQEPGSESRSRSGKTSPFRRLCVFATALRRKRFQGGR